MVDAVIKFRPFFETMDYSKCVSNAILNTIWVRFCQTEENPMHTIYYPLRPQNKGFDIPHSRNHKGSEYKLSVQRFLASFALNTIDQS